MYIWPGTLVWSTERKIATKTTSFTVLWLLYSSINSIYRISWMAKLQPPFNYWEVWDTSLRSFFGDRCWTCWWWWPLLACCQSSGRRWTWGTGAGRRRIRILSRRSQPFHHNLRGRLCLPWMSWEKSWEFKTVKMSQITSQVLPCLSFEGFPKLHHQWPNNAKDYF